MKNIIITSLLISLSFLIIGLIGNAIQNRKPITQATSDPFPEPLTKAQKNDIINTITEIMLIQRIDTIDQKIYHQTYYDHQSCYNATYQYYLSFINQTKPFA